MVAINSGLIDYTTQQNIGLKTVIGLTFEQSFNLNS